MANTISRRSIAWLGTLVVVGLCLWPSAWIPRGEDTGAGGVPHVDKLVHATLFAGCSFLWMRARGAGRPVESWAWRVLTGAIALAVLTELAQSLPGILRDPDPSDALADILGGTIATIASVAFTTAPGD